MTIKELIIILNSTTGFKYPIGNKELYNLTLAYEAKGSIKYNSLYGRWELK